MSDYSQLYEAILNGDSKKAVAITQEALAAMNKAKLLLLEFRPR